MKLKITVHGVAYEVDVEVLDPGEGFPSATHLPAPIGGTIEEINCKPGDKVNEGQILLVIEAMKMKTSIAAPAAGTVKAVKVAVGDTVHESQILVEFE